MQLLCSDQRLSLQRSRRVHSRPKHAGPNWVHTGYCTLVLVRCLRVAPGSGGANIHAIVDWYGWWRIIVCIRSFVSTCHDSTHGLVEHVDKEVVGEIGHWVCAVRCAV